MKTDDEVTDSECEIKTIAISSIPVPPPNKKPKLEDTDVTVKVEDDPPTDIEKQEPPIPFSLTLHDDTTEPLPPIEFGIRQRLEFQNVNKTCQIEIDELNSSPSPSTTTTTSSSSSNQTGKFL